MPLILGTNSIKDTGFNVDNSVRLNGSSSYLHRTPSSSGNPKKFTYSLWVKFSKIDPGNFMVGGSSSNSYFIFGAYGGGDIDIVTYTGYVIVGTTGRLFRDLSSWYHIVLACDTTQASFSDGIKLYINGVLETTFTQQAVLSESGYTQNTSLRWGTSGEVMTIGANSLTSQGFWDGYISECAFVNDQQLDATSFGEFDEDSGIWKPKDISELTFGTNGFYLDFKDSSNLGNDVSGNNNDFTSVNLSATDQSTDTCTNNFATFNPLDSIRIASGVRVPTYSDGNITITHADTNYYTSSKSTIAVNSGKWYCEAKCSAVGDQIFIGLAPEEDDGELSETYLYEDDGTFGGSAYSSAYGGSHGGSAGDIIQIAFDADNGTVWFGLNGTWLNSATQTEIENGTTTNAAASGLTMTKFWHIANKGYNGATWNFNFGSPAYAISSGNADGNGYGNFEYSVPSGYYSLCTKNLAEYG